MSDPVPAGSWWRGPLGTFTWRMLATVLGGEGLCLLLAATLARSVAATEGDRSSGLQLGLGIALGVACFVAASGMRRGWGLPVGWLIQVLALASALVVPLMLWVALLFLALWVGCLIKGRQIDALAAQREASLR